MLVAPKPPKNGDVRHFLTGAAESIKLDWANYLISEKFPKPSSKNHNM